MLGSRSDRPEQQSKSDQSTQTFQDELWLKDQATQTEIQSQAGKIHLSR